MESISVLIADDIANTREDIKRLLYFEDDIKVVGEAADGYEAVSMTGELKPDVILMDINMPKLDGIGATEQISVNFPQSAIIIISIQGEQEYLRKAMAAGAREYLVKPFSANELAEAIRRVNETQKRRNAYIMKPLKNSQTSDQKTYAKIVTFFSTKGGLGKTTLACNLAVALAQETRKRVAMLDLNLVSGDVTVMLNISAKGSIADLIREQETPDFQLIDVFMVPHLSGVRVLPAPESPELAELVQAQHIEGILKALRENFDYIIVDTAPLYNDINLNLMEESDQVVMLLNQELTTLKHAKTARDILKTLNLESKLRLILNRQSNEGIKVKELEKTLDDTFASIIGEDQKTVKDAINKGIPFVMGQPYSKMSNSIRKMISDLDLAHLDQSENQAQKKTIVNRIFSL